MNSAILAGWTVQCFNAQNGNQLEDVVICAVYAKDEKEAIKKAMTYVVRHHYRISQVVEQFDPNPFSGGWRKNLEE